MACIGGLNSYPLQTVLTWLTLSTKYLSLNMLHKQIEDIRAFNRFYTAITGLLDRYILKSRFSLSEARVLYELYHRKSCTAKEIVTGLKIDKGYLSRMLCRFEEKKLIFKSPATGDGRLAILKLSKKGKEQFETLNQASDLEVADMLSHIAIKDREKLIFHLGEIIKICQPLI